MHRYYDHRDDWRAERLMPTVTFTGTPLIPYIVADPVGSDWELEFRRVRREAEHQSRTHRFTALRHTLGGAVIWMGQRIGGVKPSDPVRGPVGDLHGAH